MQNSKRENIINRHMSDNRLNTSPLPYQRSRRGHQITSITSLPAGRVVPLHASAILREDLVKGTLRVSFEMEETAEILMNAVNVSVKAYVVPYLAFERFSGLDDLNRSYMGQPYEEGGEVIPFFESILFGDGETNEIHKYLGMHGQPADEVNSAYVEAYNLIWNYRATNRSLDLVHRDRLDETLAPAFWNHRSYQHIKPDFDQAVIDGEVALNIANAKMPVKGMGSFNNIFDGLSDYPFRESGGTLSNYESTKLIYGANNQQFYVKEDPDNPGFPDIFAELQDNGITVSLSNIELAKKTAAFAKLRVRYDGHDDDYIIDMLMSGLTVPNQVLKQPMLVAQNDTIFGMQKRYASDGENLTQSVVNGATFVDLHIRVPRLPTGGVLMIVAEILPEQIFERQQDPLLGTLDVRDLPEADRDYLDPEPVQVVLNSFVDVAHTDPNSVFGYAPLNYKWDVKGVKIGGRYYQSTPTAPFNEDRQYFWTMQTVDPKLTRDFYISTDIHTKPFADQDQDPFQCISIGQLVIEGNTQFGPALIEAGNNYDEVSERVDTSRIEK